MRGEMKYIKYKNNDRILGPWFYSDEELERYIKANPNNSGCMNINTVRDSKGEKGSWLN